MSRLKCIAEMLATLTLVFGCEQPHETATGSKQAAETAPADSLAMHGQAELERLEALGYVGWDSDADDSLRGVTRHDPTRTSPGYNLYTNEVDEVYLQDLEGRLVHTWRLKGRRHSEYAELLNDGTLLVVCEGEMLVRLAWNSDVLMKWEGTVHHDVAVVEGPSFLVPYRAQRVRYKGRNVLFDGLAQVDQRGRVERSWSTFGSLKLLQQYHPQSRLDTRPRNDRKLTSEKVFDYYHLNTVEILPETPLGARDQRFRAGNLLICLRNAHLILVLGDGGSAVTWAWGTDTLEMPHMPTMLDTGNILVFDNGPDRGHSRILEVDPSTDTIVWKYEGNPPSRFHSAWRGSAQRLPNDNTLICESERGHVFEVTRDGTIVWEFWNPDMEGNKRKRIYRFLRLAPERVEHLLRD